MNSYIGIVFTEGPIEELRQAGFVFHCDKSTMQNGYHAFKLFLADGNNIEIRVVFDEHIYAETFQVKHFEPSFFSLQGKHVPDSALISDLSIIEILTPNTVEDKDNNLFFKIRKISPIWAIRLKCSNHKKTLDPAASAQRIIVNGKPSVLFSLGPHCFDLVVDA